MASYAQRPDGLLEVSLDDGRVVPTALDPSALEAQGIYATPPQPPPAPLAMSQGSAGLGALGTPAQAPGMSDLGASPAFGQLMGAGAPPPSMAPQQMGPPAPPPPPAGNMSMMPEGGMSQAPPPALSPPMSQQPAPSSGPPEDLGRTTGAEYLQALLSQRGGSGGQLIPGKEQRAKVDIKYKEYPALDPQIAEDIGESRIDQQLATQESAEQSEQGKAMGARIAARDASIAQNELEKTIARKSQIEGEVGRRIEAMEKRFAKARAVTESGSARERVMKDKGWFGRILATIGVAMGAFAAGQTGGRNLVQDQLNKEIDEETEREKRLYDIEPEKSALKAYTDAWGTPETALKEYQLQLRAAAVTKMEAWTRRADAASVPVEFRQWLADEALRLQQGKAALQADAATEVVEHWERGKDRVVGARAPISLEDATKKAAAVAENIRKIEGKDKGDVKNQASYRKYREQGIIQLPEGGYAYHPNPDMATKIEKALHVIPQWKRNLEEIREIMSARGVSTAAKLNPADRARMEVLAVSAVEGAKAVAEEALTSGEDTTLWSKIRGANVQEIFRWADDKASLTQAIAATDQFERNRRSRMRKLPPDVDEVSEPYVPPRPPSFRPR